jgi:hypothetical protein
MHDLGTHTMVAMTGLSTPVGTVVGIGGVLAAGAVARGVPPGQAAAIAGDMVATHGPLATAVSVLAVALLSVSSLLMEA